MEHTYLFIDIVIKNNCNGLTEFHNSFPNFSIKQGNTMHIMSSLLDKISFSMFSKLYYYGYIDEEIIFSGLKYANNYDFWNILTHLLDKFDAKIIRNAIMTEKNITFTILDAFHWCHVTHYYGKLCPWARNFYNKLIQIGCNNLHDHTDFYQNTVEWQELNNPSFAHFKKSPQYEEWLKW
jgi:hypothetical protein